MDERYSPKGIEDKWQARWREGNVFAAEAPGSESKPKYYVLEMFPYPSGRLHMGHVRNYAIGDVIARARRMQGFDVLHPMGWDAFGLPAENAAIKAKAHPADWTYSNIAAMRVTQEKLGLSYDWAREIATCHPQYYRWEQQLFIQMFEKGLAYRKGAFVNFCPSCQTVLANEQVEDGRCWRCESVVTQKELTQWFFKITQYADELLRDLDGLEGGWPDKVIAMQKNWIGKSTGAAIKFPLRKALADGTAALEVFTTRPDTLMGATFLSIAAEHPLLEQLSEGTEAAKVKAFADKVRNTDKIKRGAVDYEKEGQFTGSYVLHPISGRAIPVFVANFVLMEYGTGAVMAVPAHDERDFAFAKKYGLPIEVVIQKPGEALDAATMAGAFTEAGVLVNSGAFDGTPSEDAKDKITAALARDGKGEARVSFRLRDWLISRQRYWGAPIPMIHCEACGVVPAPLDSLPIELPKDVEFTGEGSPLANHPTWSKVACPKCKQAARRDTDTMDTFVESSWYYLRFTSARHDQGMFDPKAAARWMPVDQYIGGIEHAVLHLLYARFFVKVLRDLGQVKIGEPFTRLLSQGMVCKETYRCPEHDWRYPEEVKAVEGQAGKFTCAEDGCGKDVVVGRSEKMAKTKRNVVEPLSLIERYGADAARMFSLFVAPPDNTLDYSDAAVEGMSRFIGRIWRYVAQNGDKLRAAGRAAPPTQGPPGDPMVELVRLTHKTIKKVTEDTTTRFRFNTAISSVMELLNALGEFKLLAPPHFSAAAFAVQTIVKLLSPYCPHVCEELWQELGGIGFACEQAWPVFDPALVEDDVITLAVQVNGKLRGTVSIARTASEDEARAAALADKGVAGHVEGKTVKKVVFVPGRLLNIVVG